MAPKRGYGVLRWVTISLVCCAEDAEVRRHTERKCADDPSARRDLYTCKLVQLFGNNQLPVMVPLYFIPIRHVQNKLALKTDKKKTIRYIIVKTEQYRTAQHELATDPGFPGVVSGVHVLLLAAWDDTWPQHQVEDHGRATCVLVAKPRRILQ